MTLRDLHSTAMDIATRAELARRAGEEAAAVALFHEAFELERQAAFMVVGDETAEPARSVLLRSAASLALDCNEVRESERLIATALAGNPPEEIADELRDLFDVATIRRQSNRHVVTSGHDELVRISGTLTAAHKDETHAERNQIGIRGEDGKIQNVIVPIGLMNDIVRPNWDCKVIATCSVYQNVHTLVDLSPAEIERPEYQPAN